eukprot:tig00021038_g17563.t1
MSHFATAIPIDPESYRILQAGGSIPVALPAMAAGVHHAALGGVHAHPHGLVVQGHGHGQGGPADMPGVAPLPMAAAYTVAYRQHQAMPPAAGMTQQQAAQMAALYRQHQMQQQHAQMAQLQHQQLQMMQQRNSQRQSPHGHGPPASQAVGADMGHANGNGDAGSDGSVEALAYGMQQLQT